MRILLFSFTVEERNAKMILCYFLVVTAHSSKECCLKMSEAQNESQMEVADGTSFVTEADGPAGSGTESLAQMTGLSVPSPSDESEMVTTNENVVDDELVEANDYMEEQTEETSVEAKESIGRSDLTPTGEDIVSDKTSESAHDEASPKDLALKDLESNPNSNEGLGEADLTSTNESDVITTDKTVVQKLDVDGNDEKRQPKSLITDPNVEDEKESDVTLNSTDVCSSITMCRVASGQSFEPKELKGNSSHGNGTYFKHFCNILTYKKKRKIRNHALKINPAAKCL